MNTATTAGWDMIDVSGSKPLLGPTVSGQIWTPSYGIWRSPVKQELADAVTASVRFMLLKIVSLPLIKVRMSNRNTKNHLALCHTHID